MSNPIRIDGASYAFLILGDTHYDAEPTRYHARYSEPDERLERIQRAEFARNEEIWSGRGPRLLRAAASAAREAGAAFAVHMGDLAQGDCGDPAVHERMMRDALAAFGAALGDLPLVATIGNHDRRGPGAEEVANRVLAESNSAATGRAVGDALFSFRTGPDAWLFFDFERADLKRIEAELAGVRDARRLFVVAHGPAIPSDLSGFPQWMIWGWHPDRRRALLSMLAPREAIVLTGHVHTLECTRWNGAGGSSVQFLSSSVWTPDAPVPPAEEESGAASWGTRHAGPDTPPDVRALFDAYRGGIAAHVACRGAGFGIAHVAADGSVSVDWHAGDDPAPCRTFRLR